MNASRRTVFSAICGLLLCSVCVVSEGDETWQAGVGRRKITPRQPMWMSGYASRDRPADGTLHDLWAKALVLEDPAGHRLALVTLDLVGIDRDTSLAARARLREKYALEQSQIALCCSHTHTGPVVGSNLMSMYFLDEPDRKLVADYTARLLDSIDAVVGEAIAGLAPADLAYGSGTATFAVNRRNNREADVPRLRSEGKLAGPIDHDVPVLSVRGADGKLAAVVFGYACHATVLSSFQWSGDYPGFAQLALEAGHPGTTALFWAGCGADQNPIPRRKVEQAQDYGRRLAAAVDAVLGRPMTPLGGRIRSSYEEIDLPFDKLPTTEQLRREAESDNRYVARRAQLLLEQIDSGRPLSPTYPYPIQTWSLGDELAWITLGGEVVVDYALRLKRELSPQSTWIAAYTNDVMAYIPSRRVLNEGGYEGGGAMVYYGLPTVWAPEVENLIVREVRRQSAGVGEAE